jgi:hypothetical protein
MTFKKLDVYNVSIFIPHLGDKAVGDSAYIQRLNKLAEKYKLNPTVLKALVEDAYGKPDSPPAEKESLVALRKLARLKVSVADLNWLFSYNIIQEGK